MLKIDLHSHTLLSPCGTHTILELLSFARLKGLTHLAITDHGPALIDKTYNTFYDRFINPFDDIVLYKGLECNFTDVKGVIDYPKHFLKFMDIILLGIHPNTPKDLGEDFYTEWMIAAIKNNPMVDIITHPNNPHYPLNFKKLVPVAKEHNVLLELNSSVTHFKESNKKRTLEMLDACSNAQAYIVINTDSHAVNELGDDFRARTLLKESSLSSEFVLNDSKELVEQFIAQKKRYKQI